MAPIDISYSPSCLKISHESIWLSSFYLLQKSYSTIKTEYRKTVVLWAGRQDNKAQSIRQHKIYRLEVALLVSYHSLNDVRPRHFEPNSEHFRKVLQTPCRNRTLFYIHRNDLDWIGVRPNLLVYDPILSDLFPKKTPISYNTELPKYWLNWIIMSMSYLHTYFCWTFTIRYDSVYLACSKKVTGSQLSLPHGLVDTKNIYLVTDGNMQIVQVFLLDSVSNHEWWSYGDTTALYNFPGCCRWSPYVRPWRNPAHQLALVL